MTEKPSYCGIICAKCDAFIATHKNDGELRKKTAEMWSKEYHSDIKPEDINCNGCLSDGKAVFNYCNICEIRKCASAKNVANCAHCSEYACEKLSKFFGMAKDAKTVLDEIHKTL